MSDNHNGIPFGSAGRSSSGRSFWTDVEKNHTAIESFGYEVDTEIKRSNGCVLYTAHNDSETNFIKRYTFPSFSMSFGQKISDREAYANAVSARVKEEIAQLSDLCRGAGSRFVITYYDYRIVNSNEQYKYDLYIRMEYLPSLSLTLKDEAVTVRNVLDAGLDICRALKWCHRNGRVHGNLNPDNIFLRDGSYILGDFALSCSGTNDNPVCTAPESLNSGTSTPLSDIYSLGMVMYMMLNGGQPPFLEDAPDSMELKIAENRRLNFERPAPPVNANARTAQIILKALESPRNRYQSIDDLQADIEHLLDIAPDNILDTPAGSEPPQERTTRGKKPPVAVVPEPAPEPVYEPDAEEYTEEEYLCEPDDSDYMDDDFDQPRELEPEEEEMHYQNRRDQLILTGIIAAVVAVVAVVVLIAANAGNQKIYNKIDDGSYAVAFKEISELHEDGRNVDNLLFAYIESCTAANEYKRAAQAVSLLSDDACQDTEYFVELVNEMFDHNKASAANTVLDFMVSYGPPLSDAASELTDTQ